MDLGFAYPIHLLGITHIADAARRASELALSSLWTGETRSTEVFSSLAIAGAAAPKLSLGTGVIAVQLRGPLLTAMSAGTLQAAHPDSDIFLGLGVSGRAVVETWHGQTYGDRPVEQMREFVEVLRLCFAGEPFSFAGDFYTLPKSRLSIEMVGDRKPKIVIGALNPRMLRLAGEVADGVLLNTLPASAVGWAVQRVREGERRAARPAGSCRIHGLLRLGIGDRDRHLAIGRQSLFGYCVADGYARALARAGFELEVKAAREAHRAGHRNEALAAISDDMVDSIEIVGDERRIEEALIGYLKAGIESPVVIPLLDEHAPLECFNELLAVVSQSPNTGLG
jgi:probable F420-dependent oxidoreductase